ncbi:MAG: nickel-dependent lactate racemase [Proteobacteria bacterium]|nr:nickel-dependent lactate racemase [Pseudomonadota bacterium]
MSPTPAATVRLPYDGQWVEISLPRTSLAGVCLPNPTPSRDPDRVLAGALDAPVDGLGIEDYLGPARTVLIVVNDATRPTPTARMLDHLRSRLAGRSPQLIVATGTHRAPRSGELAGMLGRHLQDLGPGLIAHDSERAGDLVKAGRTSRGTDLAFHQAVIEAERVVVLGSVEPHYYAGFTGGRKGIMPGLAGRRAIELNHRFALDPKARPLALTDNPCHLDMEEAVRMARPDGAYGINAVLDRSGDLYAAAAGGLSASFLSAAGMAREVFAVNVPAPVDVVVSAAAPPLDNDLYQMQKAVEHGRLALRPGGLMIAVSACRDGLGPSHYLRHLHAANRPEDVLTLASRAYSLGDHKAVKIAEVKMNGDLWAVTGLPEEVMTRAFFTPQPDIQTALDRALDRYGSEARVLFLPSGSLTVPVLPDPGRPGSV